MAFTGTINEDMRAVVAQVAQSWKGREVYVGCSGNFTVERILSGMKVASAIHSCDVSLYTSALGAHITGQDFRLDINPVAQEEWGWLEPWLEPGAGRLATLMLCTTIMAIKPSKKGEGEARYTAFAARQLDGYRRQWDQLHAKTVTKIDGILSELHLSSYRAMDVVDFVAAAPLEAVVTSFPPTYSGGYEHLYEVMDRVFSWDAPEYDIFTPERLEALLADITGHEFWMLSRDEPLEALEEHAIGRVKVTTMSKPVYLYASEASRTWVTQPPPQKVKSAKVSRLEGVASPDGHLRLTRLDVPTFTALRNQYLNPTIKAMGAWAAYGVLVDDDLAGCFSLGNGYAIPWADAYLASDFAIRPTQTPLLSKLVVATILTVEARVALQQSINHIVRSIGTSAFTAKPVSAKYRGLFDLHKREVNKAGDQVLHYKAATGRWNLAQAYEWWYAKAFPKEKQ